MDNFVYRQNIIWDAHYINTIGHFRVLMTLVVLQNYFDWTSLKSDLNRYIRSCVVCAIAKPMNQRQGLYTPFPIPSRPWESISMDYLMGYPTTKHHDDVILVVIDIFYKMSILIPCNKTTTV